MKKNTLLSLLLAVLLCSCKQIPVKNPPITEHVVADKAVSELVAATSHATNLIPKPQEDSENPEEDIGHTSNSNLVQVSGEASKNGYQKDENQSVEPLQQTTTKTQATLSITAKVAPVSKKITVFKVGSLLSGVIQLNSKKVKDKDVKINETVVYYLPEEKHSAEVQHKTFTISTQNKRFKPSVLVIPVGSTVVFPNLDRILHNVFSVSNPSQFDLGLYASGKQKEVTFDKTGVIYVHCNVHHAMQADILVVDTEHYVQVDSQGKFKLEGLPQGKGRLYIWHPRAQLKNIELELPYKNPELKLSLDITRAKIPLHLNKYGRSYTKRRK